MQLLYAITTNTFDEPSKKTIKSNLSDLLPIFFSITTSKSPQNFSLLKHKKRIFNENNLASFKDQISNIDWDNLPWEKLFARQIRENKSSQKIHR